MAKARPLMERFMEKVEIDPVTGCWTWKGGKNNMGYGTIGTGLRSEGTFKMMLAHRVAYELFVGEIPEGMVVCHRCDNCECVNPDHLWIGTQADNIHDRDAKGRNDHKLTKEQVMEIRTERCAHETSITVLAERYGVTRGCISSIVYGRTWKELPVFEVPKPDYNGVGVGESHINSKLSDDIVLAARKERFLNGASFTELAKKYGVTISVMRKAVLGITWAHVPMPEIPMPNEPFKVVV